MTPTAEHYARALLAAAGLMGEREHLVQIALDHTGEQIFRRRALKCRPLAYQALRVRFPSTPAMTIARRLGLATASPRAANRYRELAVIVAGRL